MLPEIRQAEVNNWLLRAMTPQDYGLLQPHLVRVEVSNGDRLAVAGDVIDSMCFPEAGIAGFLEVLGGDRRVAVGLLGREGFVGWPLLMGNDRWPHEVMARAADAAALRIEAAALTGALGLSDSLREVLLKYASTFVLQMAQTIVSNLVHPIVARTARWLLLYHDRLDSDELAITHEELGAMLGVRRASITAALHQLEGDGLIRGRRGRLIIRDRLSLERITAETYGQAEAEYVRLIGQPHPGVRPTL